jgi:hypothetical protein
MDWVYLGGKPWQRTDVGLQQTLPVRDDLMTLLDDHF